MGYKLAGFDVVGGVDIDPEMMDVYKRNFNPRLSFLMGVKDFLSKPWPSDIFEIDILDGSPPCSSFSMAGSREDAWGTKKRFREGQSNQVLDDLFFDFIAIADKMRPKIVVSENVKGLVLGSARGYVKEIFEKFDSAGYDTQLFLLNACKMGVPQSRERTFFVSRRKDLSLPKLALNFDEPVISASSAIRGLEDDGTGQRLTPLGLKYWTKTMPGDSFARTNGGTWFNWMKLHPGRPCGTLPATCRHTHWTEPRFITYAEAKRLQSFPDDYDFMDTDGRYVCGMSVPPLMMQRVAIQVARQLLSEQA